MKYSEYVEWLKENRNMEEEVAEKVVEKVLGLHAYYWGISIDDFDIFPRYWVVTDKEKLEFDVIAFAKLKRVTRAIGIEFKDTDISKAVLQAVKRREYVDYMYIATRASLTSVYELFEMAYYGIGWVLWDSNFVKIILDARHNVPSENAELLLKRLIRREAARIAKDNAKQQQLLDDFA